MISNPEFVTGAVVVALPAEMDIVNAESLGELLGAAIVPGVTVVVADLMTTNFCDCAGINSLVLASRKASASCAELRLAVRSPAVLRVLGLTGADQVLRVYPDLGTTLRSCCTSSTSLRRPGGMRGTATTVRLRLSQEDAEP
jgi:anti-anti-sigma factor